MSTALVNAAYVRTAFIAPALIRLNLYSVCAEQLLLGTAAIESRFVAYLQTNGGPARGMFQMERATFDWLYDDILARPANKALKAAVDSLCSDEPSFNDLFVNHRFSAALARVRYFVLHEAIPTTLSGQADYWWRHYNGMSPHGLKPSDYLARWKELCAGVYPAFK